MFRLLVCCLFLLCPTLFLTRAQHAAPDLTAPRVVISAANARSMTLLAALVLPNQAAPESSRLHVHFSPDSRLLIVSDLRPLGVRATYLWDVRSGAERARIEHTGMMTVPVLDPAGVALVAAAYDAQGAAKIRLWDIETLRSVDWMLRLPPEPPERSCSPPSLTGLIYAPDGTLLGYGIQFCHRTLRAWNARTGELLPLPGAFAWRSLINADVSGRLLAVFEFNGVTELRDLLTDEVVVTLPQTERISAAALTQDGSLLAHVYAGEPHISLIEIPAGTQRALLAPRLDIIMDVALSPAGALLVGAGSGSQTVSLWDAQTGLFVHALPAPDALQVAFSPDETLLAVVGVNGELLLFGVPDL